MTDSPEQLDPVALAAQHGLAKSTARPSLPKYLKQLWDRRQFILAYANARTVSSYSKSRLGQLWQVFTPLLQAGVYWFVFGYILDLSKGMDDYEAFLVTGVFVFTFLQRSMNNGAKSISGNLALIRALHFPRAVLPLSFVLVEFQQLIVSMFVLFAFLLVVGVPVAWTWLLVIPAMVLQMLFNIGLSMFMARLGSGSADFNQLLPFITRVWFYISGVFYGIGRFTDHVPELVGALMKLNPGAAFLDLYRGVLIDTHVPLSMPWGLNVWVVTAAWTAVFLVGGFVFFWMAEERYGRG